MVLPRITDDEYPAAAGAEAEEGRRPTLVSAPAAASPELSDRPRRRKFTAREKLRILGEIDRAAGIPGAIGAIMRREGLYSSAITDWRRQRDAGAYAGLSPVKCGPKPVPAHPLSAEHARLQRDYKRLEKRLERAEAVIDIQKKLLCCWACRSRTTSNRDGTAGCTEARLRHDRGGLRCAGRGWHIADTESAALFKPLFEDSVARHGIAPDELTLHADRGPSMTAKATALMLADLGVTKSHSRPYTSNDNPFSESHFKTLKYQPQFPNRFGCIQDAKTFCRYCFNWYNRDHHHLGIGLMTPDQVHYGQVDEIYAARQIILDHAFQINPERFVKRPPQPPRKPTAVWINPPSRELVTKA